MEFVLSCILELFFTLIFQNILDQMNAGREAKMNALEEAIADEKSVEEVYACRDQIYEILKVLGPLCPFLYFDMLEIKKDCLVLLLNIYLK